MLQTASAWMRLPGHTRSKQQIHTVQQETIAFHPPRKMPIKQPGSLLDSGTIDPRT